MLFYISCAQAHGVAQIGLVVEQAGDLLLRADFRNLLMACNNDTLGEKSLADIKDVLQHGRSVNGCQQLVGTEAAAYAGRHDDAGYCRIFFVHKATSRF